jgi:hypothetical protein
LIQILGLFFGGGVEDNEKYEEALKWELKKSLDGALEILSF